MMHMLGDQSLFGEGGDRGRRGEGVGGDLFMKLLLTVQYIPDRDSRVIDEVGFRVPGTGFRIPKAKKCWIPDSGFPYMGRNRRAPLRPKVAERSLMGEFVNLSIREILVLTSAYAHPFV